MDGPGPLIFVLFIFRLFLYRTHVVLDQRQNEKGEISIFNQNVNRKNNFFPFPSKQTIRFVSYSVLEGAKNWSSAITRFSNSHQPKPIKRGTVRNGNHSNAVPVPDCSWMVAFKSLSKSIRTVRPH